MPGQGSRPVQVGDGTTTDRHAPVKVTGFAP